MQTEEKKVRKKLQSGRYMTLETRKDGTKFTNRPLKEAAERLQAISRSYDQRQHALVEQVRILFNLMHRVTSSAAAQLMQLLQMLTSRHAQSRQNLQKNLHLPHTCYSCFHCLILIGACTWMCHSFKTPHPSAVFLG